MQVLHVDNKSVDPPGDQTVKALIWAVLVVTLTTTMLVVMAARCIDRLNRLASMLEKAACASLDNLAI
jgi:hypothetical protein